MSRFTESEKAEAIAQLRKTLRKGDTLYTCLRSVSSSGMSRTLDVYVMRKNEPRRLTYSVAQALGWTYDRRREALKVGGCGMDMGFHTVYTLARALWRDKMETNPGYALQQKWL